MNILVTVPQGKTFDTFFPADVCEALNKLGHVVWNDTDKNFSEAELSEKLKGIDVAFIGWGTCAFTPEVLKNADKLKLICHTGGSVAGYATEESYDRGIRILSGNELYAKSVAECVLCFSLMMLRKTSAYTALMREKGWRTDDFVNDGLFGQKFGFIGFGAIARNCVPMLKPFGCEICVHAPHLTQADADKYGITLCDTMDEVFASCKLVSLQLAKTKETYHVIGKKQLEEMQNGAILINTARGSIINEEELCDELEKGRISAALDVYEQEPLPMNSRLRKLDNVLLMPHMGGPTIDMRRIVTLSLIDEVEAVLAGASSKYECTREMMRRMTTH